MPKPVAKQQLKPRPEIVVTPKPNIVEQAPFIGYMLDELIQEQRIALIPLIQVMEQIRQQMPPPHQGGGGKCYTSHRETGTGKTGDRTGKEGTCR